MNYTPEGGDVDEVWFPQSNPTLTGRSLVLVRCEARKKSRRSASYQALHCIKKLAYIL